MFGDISCYMNLMYYNNLNMITLNTMLSPSYYLKINVSLHMSCDIIIQLYKSIVIFFL